MMMVFVVREVMLAGCLIVWDAYADGVLIGDGEKREKIICVQGGG